MMNPTTDSDRNDRGTHPMVSRVIDTPIGPLTLAAGGAGLFAFRLRHAECGNGGLRAQVLSGCRRYLTGRDDRALLIPPTRKGAA